MGLGAQVAERQDRARGRVDGRVLEAAVDRVHLDGAGGRRPAAAEADADGLSTGDAAAEAEADGLSMPVDGTAEAAGDAVPVPLQAASVRPASATVAPRRARLEWVIR